MRSVDFCGIMFNQKGVKPVATTQTMVITVLAIAVLALGYSYYQSRQNVVEIKLPSIKIERQ